MSCLLISLISGYIESSDLFIKADCTLPLAIGITTGIVDLGKYSVQVWCRGGWDATQIAIRRPMVDNQYCLFLTLIIIMVIRNAFEEAILT